MDLADELRDKVTPVNICGVGPVLKTLDPADREALIRFLALPKEEAPGAGIARVLRKRGHNVSARMVQRHRIGECSCG